MLKQTAFFDSSQWIADRPRHWSMRGCTLEVPRGAHLALGAPLVEGHDEVCPGQGRGWRLESECGLQIALSANVSETVTPGPFTEQGEQSDPMSYMFKNPLSLRAVGRTGQPEGRAAARGEATGRSKAEEAR